MKATWLRCKRTLHSVWLWLRWKGEQARAHRTWLGIIALHWVMILTMIWYQAKLNERPTEMSAEALSNGGWCEVVGREITVDIPVLYLDQWCCTVRGDEMTFFNTRPFVYGKKPSYVQFMGVSFITGMFMSVAPLAGKHVAMRGRIISYQGTPEIIINDPSQIWEVNDAHLEE